MTEFIAETEEEVREGLASGKVEKLDGFDYHAGRYWIYPINREIRDYQYCIVHQALFNNTLVVLPTGLGKTLIAAVVMYNIYLWYPQSKIVFMAPTRPLVKQQMEACFDIVGIPREDIVELTGHTTPFKRQEEWQTKRLFFLTPQVMQNDLFLNDYCPAEKIKCIVVDEAHKATGGYAYTRVVEEVYKRNTQFRILALSATPGKDLIHIKHVLKNLLISKIEYRSEESLDVQKYTHTRRVETIVVQLDGELSYYRDRLLSIIEENLKTLVKRKALASYDLNRLSSYYLLVQRRNFEAGQHNMPKPLINSIGFTFSIATSLIYALDLLKNHGLRSFYNHVRGNHTEDSPKGKGKKGFNLGTILKKNTILQEILEDLKNKFEPDGDLTFNGDLESDTIHSVPGHPKLVKLQEIVLNHFDTEGDDTRIMIFSQFRASVEEITCLLRQHTPKIRPVQFVGQSSVKRRGFSQKQQLEVINRFREGEFNVLVATCVAEEGLDIGNVDLIICYDANKSPIRLVQRMGRTGRAREGRIIVLTTAGKEEEAHNDSVYNKKRVASNLLSGVKQEDLFQENIRLYPKGLKPICRKLHLGVRQEKGSDGSNNENESTESIKAKDKSTTKKRISAGSSTKKRNSVTKRPSSGGSTVKKRKNRFIYQDEEGGDDASIDDDLPVPKKSKKRPSSDTPSKSATKKKRKQSNDISLNLEAPMESNPTDESLNQKSFSTSVSSYNEISFDDIPDNLFDEALSEGDEDGQSNVNLPQSTGSSPVQHLDEGSLFEKEQQDNENSGEKDKPNGKEDDNEVKEMESDFDEDVYKDFNIEKTPPKSSKSSTFKLGPFTQIKGRLMHQDNNQSKSVPVKKNKWAEFLSSDDSYDSLDYNPLKESPKDKSKRDSIISYDESV